MRKSAASALQHLFCLRSRLVLEQWPLAPEQKICSSLLAYFLNLVLNHYMRMLLAGSFDPPTLGHLDLIQRAHKLCDELIIALAENTAKKKKMFSLAVRTTALTSLTKKFPHVKVVTYKGLTVHFAKKTGCQALVRGLRSPEDFQGEIQLALANKKLTGIETVFLLANPEFAHISSTLIKEIATSHGSLKEFVPPSVEKLFRKKPV